MLRFGNKKVVKEKCYGTKRPIKVWDGNVDNLVISQLVETEKNSKSFNWVFRWNYKTISFDIT